MPTGAQGRKDRVRRALEDRGVRQVEIATATDLTEAAISRIIGGSYSNRTVRSKRTMVRVLRVVSARTDIPLEELTRERGILASELPALLGWVERDEQDRAAKHAAAMAAA